jgi:hypothetical protein
MMVYNSLKTRRGEQLEGSSSFKGTFKILDELKRTQTAQVHPKGIKVTKGRTFSLSWVRFFCKEHVAGFCAQHPLQAQAEHWTLSKKNEFKLAPGIWDRSANVLKSQFLDCKLRTGQL